MSSAREKRPLHVISLLQAVEREIERLDNRQEFDGKTSRRQPFRQVIRIDACRARRGFAERQQTGMVNSTPDASTNRIVLLTNRRTLSDRPSPASRLLSPAWR